VTEDNSQIRPYADYKVMGRKDRTAGIDGRWKMKGQTGYGYGVWGMEEFRVYREV
jgi:hypothetical protein